MLIKKKTGHKSTEMIEADIRYGFSKIMSQSQPIYSITINNKLFKTTKELRFTLTNLFFNRIRKYYKFEDDILNYFFVIEYPEVLSRGNFMIDDINVHCHILLASRLSEETLKFYIEMIFDNKSILEKEWYKIEPIHNREDKNLLIDYLVKQAHLFTDDNYNYKINITNSK
jgi:hypothetical protein